MSDSDTNKKNSECQSDINYKQNDTPCEFQGVNQAKENDLNKDRRA